MSKDKSNEENVERVVFEVRRTTHVPKVDKQKFVFEKNEVTDEWEAHFAAATKYSLTQMKEIVSIMENAPMDGTKIAPTNN